MHVLVGLPESELPHVITAPTPDLSVSVDRKCHRVAASHFSDEFVFERNTDPRVKQLHRLLEHRLFVLRTEVVHPKLTLNVGSPNVQHALHLMFLKAVVLANDLSVTADVLSFALSFETR